MKTSVAEDRGSFLVLSILGCLGELIGVLRVSAFSQLRSAFTAIMFCDPPRNSVKERYPSSVYFEVLSPVTPRLVLGSQEIPSLHLIASDH